MKEWTEITLRAEVREIRESLVDISTRMQQVTTRVFELPSKLQAELFLRFVSIVTHSMHVAIGTAVVGGHRGDHITKAIEIGQKTGDDAVADAIKKTMKAEGSPA